MALREIRLAAEKALSDGVTTKEALLKALPALIKLQEAVHSTIKAKNECVDIALKLGDVCAAYAVNHPTVWADDAKFENGPDGTPTGDVLSADGKRRFHLIHKLEKPSAIEGCLTQEKLKLLPTEWVKSRKELDTTAINNLGVSDEELNARGLERLRKYIWTEKE